MIRISLLALAAAALLSTPAAAQVSVLPSEESIEATIDGLAGEESDAERATWISALEALRTARTQQDQATSFREETERDLLLLAPLQEELKEPRQEASPRVPRNATLADIENERDGARAALEAASAEVERIAALARFRESRLVLIQSELASAREDLRESERELAALVDRAASAAELTLVEATGESHRQTIESLTAEQTAYKALAELLSAESDSAERRKATATEVATFWEARLEEARLKDGEETAAEIGAWSREIVEQFPELGPVAQEIVELAGMRSGEDGLPSRIAIAAEALSVDKQTLADVVRQRKASERRIDAGGLTDGMAVTLRRDFESLPRAQIVKSDAKARARELSRGQLELVKLEEMPPADAVQAADDWLSRIAEADRTEELRDSAERLFESLRAAHRAASDDLRQLNGIFYEHRRVATQLEAEVAAYRTYIEERILWVRSSADHFVKTTLRAPRDAAALLRSFSAESLMSGLRASISESWLRFSVLVLALGVLVALRRLLRTKRAELGLLVRSYRTDSYVYTVRAIVQTLLLALPFPLAAWGLGWLLSTSPDTPARAFGSALSEMSVAWLVLRVLRGILTDKGVGSAHFRWRQADVAAVHRELRWLEPLAVPLGVLVLALDRMIEADASNSVGRIGFVVWMGAFAYFLHRMLRAESPIWRSDVKGEGRGLMGHARGLWTKLVVATPIVLAVLAMVGYYYTALEFEFRLRCSVGLALVLVLINALLARWLFITRRQLAVEQALEAKARREQAQSDDASTEHQATFDAEQIDIPSVDAQTRQLFKSSLTLASVLGLYMIWASVLPALQRLDRIQLLPTLAVLETEESRVPSFSATEQPATEDASQPDAGASATSTTPGMYPRPTAAPIVEPATEGIPTVLTLGDVLLALIFLALTSVAARNLPALIELAVLRRLPLDGGARYAITTIVRYLILIVGVSAISGALGIGWKKIQWLAAALTFGLAFGLQEIFANFVSGLIILIERPIRVGDIVTAGGIEGRITQLRMRATTLLDYDRREFLIPNKEFITGSVINWTLSDPITRVVFPVGIAYGSDTNKARSILMKVAAESTLVMVDPPPSAIFRKFGDSTLDFQLRVYLGNRDGWAQLVDELHSAIDQAFRAAGIEIAFPQRDIHVRSIARAGASLDATLDPDTDAAGKNDS